MKIPVKVYEEVKPHTVIPDQPGEIVNEGGRTFIVTII